MADFDNDIIYGFVDKRLGRGIPVGGAAVLAESNNYDNLNDMRTRLTALDAGYFTAARLNQMTENDIVYALRLRSTDSAGI